MASIDGSTASPARMWQVSSLRTEPDAPLRWPALCLALLALAPTLYLTQSFLAVGDPTPANVLVAMLSGLLQWCAVLAAWGLLPLALWR